MARSSARAAALGVCLALVPVASGADPGARGPTVSSPAAGSRPYRDQSHVAWLAERLADDLVFHLEPAEVAALEVNALDPVSPRGARMLRDLLLRANPAGGGRLVRDPRAEVVARVQLSLSDTTLYAVGQLIADGAVRAVVARTLPVDREVEALLLSRTGLTDEDGLRQQLLTAQLPGVRAVTLADLDRSEGDELVLLYDDRLVIYRFLGNELAPLRPVMLEPAPERRVRYPRGALATRQGPTGTELWWGHSDGRAGIVSWPRRRQRALASETAPLCGIGEEAIKSRFASPHPALVDELVLGVEPQPVEGGLRAVACPGRWLSELHYAWVDGARRVRLQPRSGAAVGLDLGAPVGDVMAVVEFGRPLLALTLPGDGADELSFVTLTGEAAEDSQTLEGPVVAMAAGDLDFDGEDDLIVVEEVAGAARLRRFWRGR